MMDYLQIVLVPILMLASRALLVSMTKLKANEYAKHIQQEAPDQLNPFWQKDDEKGKWFSPRLIFVAILLTTLLLFFQHQSLDDHFKRLLFQGLLGFCIVIYASFAGECLSMIFLFRYLNKNPQGMSGSVSLSNIYVMKWAYLNYWSVFLPFLFLSFLDPSSFVIGGTLGLLLMMGRGWIRFRRAKVQQKT